MTSSELLFLISKPWLNITDIKKIAGCGRDNATKIRDNIRKKLLESGKSLPTSRYIIIPSRNLIDYLDLDINYITDMAKKELSIRKE